MPARNPIQPKIVFILSDSLRQFDQILAGFHQAYPNVKHETLNLSGLDSIEPVINFIKIHNPDLIIALGARAATLAATVEKKRPIVFTMVINYRRYPILAQPNLTGIAMELPPRTVLTQFRLLYPEVRAIGIPYHPKVTREVIADQEMVANTLNLKIVTITILDTTSLVASVKQFRSTYNALWMIADYHLYNHESGSHHHLIDFAYKNKIPVLTFSEAFVRVGGYFSVSVDYTSLGSQVALIALSLVLDRIKPNEIGITTPIGTYTVLNKGLTEEYLGQKRANLVFPLVDKLLPEED